MNKQKNDCVNCGKLVDFEKLENYKNLNTEQLKKLVNNINKHLQTTHCYTVLISFKIIVIIILASIIVNIYLNIVNKYVIQFVYHIFLLKKLVNNIDKHLQTTNGYIVTKNVKICITFFVSTILISFYMSFVSATIFVTNLGFNLQFSILLIPVLKHLYIYEWCEKHDFSFQYGFLKTMLKLVFYNIENCQNDVEIFSCKYANLLAEKIIKQIQILNSLTFKNKH